jgi:hypothetical protein
MEPAGNTIPKKMKDWDILFSLIMILACVALIVYSLMISFDAMKATDAVFYTAPGFAPLLIGIIILCLAIILLVEGIKNGGSLGWLLPANLVKIYTSRSFRDTFLVFLYLFLYMWLFWERIPFTRIRVPFWLGTFLFLVGMMTTFKAAKLKTILVISAVASFIIQISFGYFAGIPLP